MSSIRNEVLRIDDAFMGSALLSGRGISLDRSWDLLGLLRLEQFHVSIRSHDAHSPPSGARRASARANECLIFPVQHKRLPRREPIQPKNLKAGNQRRKVIDLPPFPDAGAFFLANAAFASPIMLCFLS